MTNTAEYRKTRTLPISVPGDIVSTNAEQLRSRIFGELKLLNAPIGRLDIDLSRAAMVDSVGLNLLASVIKYVKSHGGSTRFMIGNNNVERTFRFTRLDTQAELVRV